MNADLPVPVPSRPHMPGYGIVPADGGAGLLHWTWATERLVESHDFWVATVHRDGRPHVMPVWGVWRHGALWFSSSVRSRKYRNLCADPRCTATTDDPHHPVVLEGHVTIVTDAAEIGRFLDASNAKYAVSYEPDFLDPAVNATFRLDPDWAFALDDEDFTGTPTRWTFDRGGRMGHG